MSQTRSQRPPLPIAVVCVSLATAGGLAQQPYPTDLPFHEGFEPDCGTDPLCDPSNCAQDDRGGWGWTAQWQTCDHSVSAPGCPDDPLLPACPGGAPVSRCWGPFKFESWPDLCAGGRVFAGYRAGRQPTFDPYWSSMFHDFNTPANGVGDLDASVWQYDSAGIVCTCECNCDPVGPLYGYPNGRPNYQIQGWLCLETPDRAEAFALGINTYSSWVYLSWYTNTDGWNRTSVARVPAWRKLEIVVHPYRGLVGDVEFKIDDATVGLGRRATSGVRPIDVTRLRLGGDPALITQNVLTNTFQDLWYDEVNVEFVPAPCPPVRLDVDDDGDVDMADFGLFQRCWTGPDNSATFDALDCHCFDVNGDLAIDNTDFTAFLACVSGPTVAATPGCANQAP